MAQNAGSLDQKLEKEKEERTERRNMILYLGLTLCAFLALSLILLFFVGREDTYRAELILPLLLCIGTAGLILILAMIAVVFKGLELSNAQEPLGLPTGSVRSVIALSLILIFIMTSLFLFAGLGQPAPHQSNGLAEEAISLLPPGQILSISRSSVISNTEEVLYDVTVQGNSQAAEDVAKQTLTVVSTLVVAVAGFYFGSRSVETAKRATSSEPRAASAPRITQLDPSPAQAAGQLYVFGDNFDEPAAGSAVMVHDKEGRLVITLSPGTGIDEWQDNRIGFVLPGDLAAGSAYKVRVVARARVSDPMPLTISPAPQPDPVSGAAKTDIKSEEIQPAKTTPGDES